MGTEHEPEPRACQWREDEDGTWHTSCGQAWEFIDGDPAANRVHFCHYCGQRVQASALRGPEDL